MQGPEWGNGMKIKIAAARAQRISSEQAAGFVASGMWLDYGVALCQPDVLDEALAAWADTLKNVKIRSCLSMKRRAVLESDIDGKHRTITAASSIPSTS